MSHADEHMLECNISRGDGACTVPCSLFPGPASILMRARSIILTVVGSDALEADGTLDLFCSECLHEAVYVMHDDCPVLYLSTDGASEPETGGWREVVRIVIAEHKIFFASEVSVSGAEKRGAWRRWPAQGTPMRLLRSCMRRRLHGPAKCVRYMSSSRH